MRIFFALLSQLSLLSRILCFNIHPPLPWAVSLEESRDLVYMDLVNSQLEIMKNLGFKEYSIDQKFAVCHSSKKKARIGTICMKSEKFRKVRLTYFDGGNNVQVFNTLWYPSFEYDAPLFGADLISLGSNRVLSVIDFQPLYPSESYSNKYIRDLASIRNKYPDLHGTLSGKIYDDTSFFSKQMLFGRFTDESKIKPVVIPAFTEYLNAYITSTNNIKPITDSNAMATVKSRQAAYDTYSAIKDPAVGLFEAYFSKEWATSFVHDVLFDLSNSIPQHHNEVGVGNSNASDEHPASTASQKQSLSPVHAFKVGSDGNVAIDSKTSQSRASSSAAVDSRKLQLVAAS